jgi:NAD(P)-dependent dehydrogenase (short-subunit alcohol dehydrogenase family)
MPTTPEPFRLAHRVALVTGGAGIYGTAITEALAAAGARVVIGSRGIEAGTRLAERLTAEGGEVHAVALDLASQASIDAARAWLLDELGGIDVLVNNAVARVGGDPETQDEAAWAAAMEINSTGLYRACRAFGGAMAQRGRGAIVNVASIYGVVAPDFAVYEGMDFTSPPDYAYAKGGMISLTRYLASYYGRHGVRVNVLSPGGCRTDEHPDAFAARYAQRTMLGRMGAPEDVKGPIVFLASDASRYVTGHNLIVDGGLSAL